MSHGHSKADERIGFIESERIISILDDTTEKLGFLDRCDFVIFFPSTYLNLYNYLTIYILLNHFYVA